MFQPKDITKAKALKPTEEHKVGFITARRNKDSTLSFNFRKKIVGTARKSPVAIAIAMYYSDNEIDIDAINDKTNEYAKLCNQGLHPKDHLKKVAEEKAIEEAEAEKIIKNKQRTFRQVVEEYNLIKLRNGQNSQSTIDERMKVINKICPEWWDLAFEIIDYDKVSEAFNIYAYQKGRLGYAKNWGRNLKGVWGRGVKRGYTTVNPFIELSDEVGGFDSGTTENNYLISEEVTYIANKMDSFTTLDRSYGRGNQIQALKLLLYTGIRLEEALSLKWEHVHMNEEQPYIYFPLGNRKQKQIEYVIPILSKMKDIFVKQKEVERNDYVFPSYKNKTSYITDINFALKVLRPPTLDTKKGKVLGGKTRVVSFTQKTLRRTWSQIGLELGYSMSMLNFVSGRSKYIDSSNTSYNKYVSNSLNTALPYFIGIIDIIEGKKKTKARSAEEVLIDNNKLQEDKERLKKQDINLIEKLQNMVRVISNKGGRKNAPDYVKQELEVLEKKAFYAELRERIRNGHEGSEDMLEELKRFKQPLP